ncbi:hypothetical protein [Glycomyces paridis]|uniref:Uncharacterized protein n=1 Tax=Glycomyces paridis TaxID=2126555 RepID=A0A4S8PM39_9ACTN|nr:hypothetical protein [Glycomyces paridis]THV30805.1 hypothetical protein E9998_05350 [Glycomyces paridis]
MDSALFLLLALAHLALLVWGATLASQSGRAANLALPVVAALVYDNAVIAAGSLVGEGAMLEGLNAGRFWLHALLTPLLVVWAWDAVRRSDAAWAARPWARWSAVGLAPALAALELATVVVGLDLHVRDEHGALSYTAAHAGGPPPMVLVVAAALLAAGAVLWRRDAWPWLFAGALLMSLGSGVPIPLPTGAVTNAFEVLLLAAIIATTAHQKAPEPIRA